MDVMKIRPLLLLSDELAYLTTYNTFETSRNIMAKVLSSSF